jgi:site-specific DNA-methyltransferase (adenine-specific)
MRIDEATFKAMPPELQALFVKLPNPGSEEVVGLFPQTGTAKAGNRGAGKGATDCYGVFGGDPGFRGHDDNGGSAARFFYTAKASKSDRDKDNRHPTVKPTDLMRYLCRLVTPPGGIVLDPFMGSGSTGKGALLEGFVFIGIEREEESHATAEARLSRVASAGHQLGLGL